MAPPEEGMEERRNLLEEAGGAMQGQAEGNEHGDVRGEAGSQDSGEEDYDDVGDDDDEDYYYEDLDEGESEEDDSEEEDEYGTLLDETGAEIVMRRRYPGDGEGSRSERGKSTGKDGKRDEEKILEEERAALDRFEEAKHLSLNNIRGILHANLGGQGGCIGNGKSDALFSIAKMLRSRESLRNWSSAKRRQLSSRVLPHGSPETMDVGDSRAYIGHFAEDGNVFIAGFQNQLMRLYEVKQSSKPWTLRKEIVARALNWTITDTSMSPNNQLLVYSTISPVLHVVNINASDNVRSLQNITDLHTPLDFGDGRYEGEGAFGIWAISFSADGKYILAGCSNFSTYLYDVQAQRVVVRAHGHRDDVNTVAFLDDTSNVYVSGSDDCTIRIWDRRCLGTSDDSSGSSNRVSSQRSQGSLQGHTEGLTYISSKGDGRYFISNGKDQKCKLWDIRMAGESKPRSRSKARMPRFYWDYRWQPYPADPEKIAHPSDQSLMTFTGHKVLQTLIRCRWSPMETTGQRYIFSGSQCGRLFVYDVVEGKQAAVYSSGDQHSAVMRDCDWHPEQPLLASVSWDGCVVRWKTSSPETD
mmetsp:Transcript_5107/g.13339  ORF Transcript_5107/g.13339 Transcript_5107/m.13339 type:complete len:584 (-) Transcript_5107:165-1916(-)